MRFNPSNYSVKEGVDSNAVITLEALADHPNSAFTVTVLTQDGTATREYSHSLQLCVLTLKLPFAHSTQVTLTMRVNVSL